MTGWRRVLTVGVLVLFFVVGFLGLVLGKGLSRNPDPQREDQCELLATNSDRGAAVLEPQNTWSNFGYLVAGAIILYRSRTLLGAMVGVNLEFEFLFSSLYHSKLTSGFQTIDVAWIYVLLLSLIAYGIQSLLSSEFSLFAEWPQETAYPTFTPPVFIALGICAIVIVAGILMELLGFESTLTTLLLVAVVAVLLAGGLILAAVRGGRAGAIVVIVVQIVAVGIPTLIFKFSDGKGNHFFFFPNLCCPKASLQSHSGWHLLSAVMVAIAYDFFANFSGDGRVFSIARSAREFVPESQAY